MDWICREPECDVVYFGDAGDLLNVGDIRDEPGFKTAGARGLLCYCFRVRRNDVQAELERSGTTTVVERINEKVRAGQCACDVRNPSGKCCLGDVRRAVKELMNQRPSPEPITY